MMDNLDPREEAATPARKTEGKTEQEPTMDREVPLQSAHTPEAIHAWLDGENVNETQLKAAGKEYEFWQRVEAETGKRRRMRTPSPLAGEIMKAIKKD